MEKELNIAAILKDKPVGTKLYSPCCGVCTKGDDGSSKRPITLCLPNRALYHLLGNGKEFESGEIMVYPSKEMRDWSKFAWKKGDVLVNKSGFICIFREWATDDYMKFNGCYSNSRDGYENVQNAETIGFSKVDGNTSYEYIHKIEEKLGGTFNTLTLEIEKPEPQFKDGDIVCFYGGRGCFDTIAIIKKQGKPTYKVYAFLEIPIMKFYYQDDKFFPYTRKLRFATDSEKQQLFEALAKEGKRWNPETKTLEDLPKKCEFKPMNPMDLCLMRDFGETWKLCQFGFMEEVYAKDNAPYNAVGGNWFNECIPYNDQTAHLLGTTDDWKGGEE